MIIVSLLGILAFGGVFLLLGPEWWSSSLGTLKNKKKPGEDGPSKGGSQQDKSQKGG
ncbi:hypothetical protein D187_000770 [Cystobacter fuscus DSM 2262]|uniref:Uncharacterized protein n=1 Tax=Cystobacter fuscus (strain ATCC 25194 / DSM 2262 / NBRC 100088 / M29) TaxID=1242864 RepID=S9QVF2_CYSF2|nr:hypothetical protein D187_000770 [Cystobacter fuscus DSM 2262]